MCPFETDSTENDQCKTQHIFDKHLECMHLEPFSINENFESYNDDCIMFCSLIRGHYLLY